MGEPNVTPIQNVNNVSPCPFCDKSHIYWDSIFIDDGHVYFLVCKDCGCEGPFAETKALARAKWEKRATSRSAIPAEDYDSILIQLARLAQFERLILADAECNMGLACIDVVRREHERFTPGVSRFRPALELVDIPAILAAVNRELQTQHDAAARFDQHDLSAATAAFIGILCRK